jgi:hypothetical protein
MKKLIIGLVSTAIVFTACKNEGGNKGATGATGQENTATAKVSATKPSDEELKKGYQVFKNTCSACHWEDITPEKIKEVKEYVKKHGKPPFGGPPMSEVSARVKKFYPDEQKFVEFVKDYITNPSKDKGVCLPKVYNRFGVMPPIGKNLSEEEKEAVAKWLYHRFEMSWEEFMQKNPH